MFFEYDGNVVFVVFIGARVVCERVREFIVIIIEYETNYFVATSSFKEEEEGEQDDDKSGDDATRTRVHERLKTPRREREIRRRVRRKIRPGNARSSPLNLEQEYEKLKTDPAFMKSSTQS